MVYSATSQDAEFRTEPSDYRIPKSIADMINSIGVIIIREGIMEVCPQPETQPTNEADLLETYGTLNNLTPFNAFVRLLEDKQLIRTETITPKSEGTAFWIMSARAQNDAVAAEAGVVYASAVFKKFTQYDAIMCALIQNSFTGTIDHHSTFLWTIEPITNIKELRNTFALNA